MTTNADTWQKRIDEFLDEIDGDEQLTDEEYCDIMGTVAEDAQVRATAKREEMDSKSDGSGD